MREATLDMQGLVFTITELVSYVHALRAAQRNLDGPLSLSARERQNVDLVIQRGRNSFTRIQPLIGRLSLRPAKTAAEHQTLPNPISQAAPRPSIELIAVEGDQYAATLMLDVLAPRPVNKPNDQTSPCQYPEAAMPTLSEGSTVVRLLIDATGSTTDESVVRPSGSDELDSAALKCMTTRQFQPARRGSKPVTSVIQYTITWKADWGQPNASSCQDIKTDIERRPTPSPPAGKADTAALICTCFEESGKPGTPALAQSSGNPRLDNGALKLANKTPTRPRPPGHSGCFGYRIKFDLRDDQDR